MSDMSDPNLDQLDDFGPEDYTSLPLIGAGTYTAAISKVELVPSRFCLEVSHELSGNEDVLKVLNSDGEFEDTEDSVDGSVVVQKIWLPKPEDANTMEANGRCTKREGKIRRAMDAIDALGFGKASMAEIKDAIEKESWIGTETIVKVELREYPEGSGQFNSEVKSAHQA